MTKTNVPRSKAIAAFGRAQMVWTVGIVLIGACVGYRLARPDRDYLLFDLLSYVFALVGFGGAVMSVRRARAIIRAYPDLVEGTRLGRGSEVSQWGCWGVLVLAGSFFLAYYLAQRLM